MSCRTSRRGPNGFLHGGYTADEVDAFAAFSFELNRCFFLPVDRVDDGTTSNFGSRRRETGSVAA